MQVWQTHRPLRQRRLRRARGPPPGAAHHRRPALPPPLAPAPALARPPAVAGDVGGRAGGLLDAAVHAGHGLGPGSGRRLCAGRHAGRASGLAASERARSAGRGQRRALHRQPGGGVRGRRRPPAARGRPPRRRRRSAVRTFATRCSEVTAAPPARRRLVDPEHRGPGQARAGAPGGSVRVVAWPSNGVRARRLACRPCCAAVGPAAQARECALAHPVARRRSA